MKKNYLILDTETNSITTPYVYNIGWVIQDKKGNAIRKRNYLIKEGIRHIKESFYGCNKTVFYLNQIIDDKVKIVNWVEACEKLKKDIEKYKIKELFAYNSSFDKRAIQKTCERLLTDNPVTGLDWYCLYNASSTNICDTNKYCKKGAAENWITQKGNLLTNAECVYRFITDNIEFFESHTALEDAIIEGQILSYLLEKKKKTHYPSNGMCWKIPQERFRKILEEME
jgi:hypothetical protein